MTQNGTAVAGTRTHAGAMDSQELAQRVSVLEARLQEAETNLDGAIREDADATKALDLARANAYLASSGTVAEREGAVAKATADEKHRARLAENTVRARFETLRDIRQVISGLGSVASLRKSEEFNRGGQP